MKYTFLIFFLFIFTTGIHAENNYFKFSIIPNMPPNSGYSTQPGLAGLYTGMEDGVLIVAGGANFPDKLPWEGGIKTYYDEIFILKTDATGEYSWEKVVRDWLLYFAPVVPRNSIVAQSWVKFQMR